MVLEDSDLRYKAKPDGYHLYDRRNRAVECSVELLHLMFPINGLDIHNKIEGAHPRELTTTALYPRPPLSADIIAGATTART